MGRFNSLELDSEPAMGQGENTDSHPQGEAIRDAEFYLHQARRQYIQHELEPALRSYSKALEIDPGSLDAWSGQIKCLISLNELREADMWAKKASEIAGESQELLAIRARICCRRGDFDRAYGLSDASLQAQGNSPMAWTVRGEIMLYARGKEPEYCFDKAVAAVKQDFTVSMDIAECCIFAGKYALAFKYLKPALDDNPASAPLWMLAADCQLHFGNRGKALQCLDAVKDINPSYPSLREAYERVNSENGIKNLFRRIFSGH